MGGLLKEALQYEAYVGGVIGDEYFEYFYVVDCSLGRGLGRLVGRLA
jgi:hypothetical protein